MALTFNNQNLLWFLLLVPVVIYIYYLINQKKKKDALKFSHLALIKKAIGEKRYFRNHIIFSLSLFSVILLILALADPNIPLKQTKEGVNVVLVIDDSGSMQANDYNPTRLEAAKKSGEILIKSLKPNDNIGIILFENGATTASYLTPFKDKAISKLMAIKQKEGKTAIGDGLSMAVDMVLSIPNKKKVIILLSDGVNNAGVISPQEAAQFAKTNKIQVYTVGMGSVGKVVLGYDWFGNPQYAELDEASLKQIAEATGGKYFKSVNVKTLDEIYKNISEDIIREKEPVSIKNWFIIAGMFLILLELYLRYGGQRVIQ